MNPQCQKNALLVLRANLLADLEIDPDNRELLTNLGRAQLQLYQVERLILTENKNDFDED